jgi:hypothetical protein
MTKKSQTHVHQPKPFNKFLRLRHQRLKPSGCRKAKRTKGATRRFLGAKAGRYDQQTVTVVPYKADFPFRL